LSPVHRACSWRPAVDGAPPTGLPPRGHPRLPPATDASVSGPYKARSGRGSWSARIVLYGVGCMTEPLGVALVGCGTVGGGVARLLVEPPERLAARAGRPLVLRRVVVRTPDKPRAVPIARELLTTDLDAVIRDPRVQVAAELVGGVDWARQAVLRLLAAG